MGFKRSTPVILDPDLLTVGQETISRILASSNGATVAPSGSLRLSYWTARESALLSQVRFISGNVAAGATPTLVRIGLYSIDSNGNGTLIGSIASDTSLFSSVVTIYTRTLIQPVPVTMGQRYTWGILLVSAAATPTIVGNGSVPVSSSVENATPPRLFGSLAGQADLPNTFLESALTNSNQIFYMVGL